MVLPPSKQALEAGWGLISKYSAYDGPPDDAPFEDLVTTFSGMGAPETAAMRVGAKPALSMDGWDESIRTLQENYPGKHKQTWFGGEDGSVEDVLGDIHDATSGSDSWAYHASPPCGKISRANEKGKADPSGAMEMMRFNDDIMSNIREWENPPSMMSVEQSPDIIPYLTGKKPGFNQGISQEWKPTT